MCFHVDNLGVVAILRKYSASNEVTHHLLHCLYFYSSFFQFEFSAEHVPGLQNNAADALLRNNITLFSSLLPQATKMQVPVVLLDQSVHEHLTNSLAPTTQAAYRSSASHYLTFCSQFNLTPLPLTQVNITRFIAYLARMGVSYQSTRPYLAWVHFLQIASGFPDHGLDTLPQLYYVLWGVRRLSQTSSCPPRLLITPEILQLLYVQWSQASQEDGFHAAMLWAACCTVFYGFMRAAEFGAL